MTTTYKNIKIVTEVDKSGTMLHVVFFGDEAKPFTTMQAAMNYVDRMVK